MFLTDKSSGLNLIILAPAALVNSREKLCTDGRKTLKPGDNGFLIEFSRCRLYQLTFFSSTRNRAFQFCMNKSRCDWDLIICFRITISSIFDITTNLLLTDVIFPFISHYLRKRRKKEIGCHLMKEEINKWFQK